MTDPIKHYAGTRMVPKAFVYVIKKVNQTTPAPYETPKNLFNTTPCTKVAAGSSWHEYI